MFSVSRSSLALVCLLLTINSRAEAPLVFHYPDSGAPPWLYLAPGGNKPVGLVADIVEAAAKRAGRDIRYDFKPRENNNEALQSGSADGALFFGITRPPAKDVVVTEPLLRMDTVLVTLRGRAINYTRPLDLQNKRLCTLTEEVYPPLTLLAMNGTLMLRKAKTEQAQLMMLRNEDCIAAILNGPMYRWLSTKYRWEDLRIEAQPLLNDSLVLGFAADEKPIASAIDDLVKKLRTSGEWAQWISRHLPNTALIGMK